VKLFGINPGAALATRVEVRVQSAGSAIAGSDREAPARLVRTA
jgi:hypothetical protein